VVRPQLPASRDLILYPPIDVESFKPGKKENLILSVARFDSPSHAKRQDVLIEAFTKLHQVNQDYKLVLAGGVMGEGGESYLNSLKKQANGLPVSFVVNSDFGQLKKLYAKAKIFWHAAGYGIDERLEPEKVEHFGMTTVEAMAAGVVPVVIDKGGQREIITGDTGYLCESVDEIVASTLSLLNSPEKLRLMSENTIKRSSEFSSDRFNKEVREIIGL
jgi:glycosyltransferase involved in cell wall biosynthesis